MKNTKKTGNLGESLAAEFLKDKKYKIIALNLRNKGGEIDIIALDNSGNNETIVFIEVKSRRSFKASPAEAVNLRKQIKITKTANLYLQENKLFNMAARFDVIEVYLPSFLGANPQINHLENAFDEIFE